MKTHGQISHLVMQPRTITVANAPGAQRTDPLVKAAHGLVILALVWGGLGATGAQSLGHGVVRHTHHPAHNASHAATAHVSTSHGKSGPWMY